VAPSFASQQSALGNTAQPGAGAFGGGSAIPNAIFRSTSQPVSAFGRSSQPFKNPAFGGAQASPFGNSGQQSALEGSITVFGGSTTSSAFGGNGNSVQTSSFGGSTPQASAFGNVASPGSFGIPMDQKK
jgi:hypothetical protein